MASLFKNLQVRRGTNADFNEKDPVLKAGEPAIAMDTQFLKIGDGTSKCFIGNDVNSATSGGIASKREISYELLKGEGTTGGILMNGQLGIGTGNTNMWNVKKFEADLLEKVRNDYSEILENINTSGKLEDNIKTKLIEVIEVLKEDKK